MNILITGAAGFIGSTISQELCKKKNNKVYGIDNLDLYSGNKIKKLRLKILLKNKNFYFKKIDLSESNKVENYIKNKKFDLVLHFGALVGVRYSLERPDKYIVANINSFFNLLNSFKKYRPKKIIYASSSSVYGETKKFPVFEKDKLNPKNIYALSKVNNEQMAEIYSKNFKTKFVGLRLFTVFGEMGRPDMFLFKILKSHFKKKLFYLNNKGNYFRDFTYIQDVKKQILKLIEKNNYSNHEIFNICSNRPINLLKIIKYLKDKLGKIKIKNAPINKADVYKTHGSNKKIKKITKINQNTDYKVAIDNTIKWYKKYKVFNLD
jgi:UDP-glucuronate 4-epimerase